MINYVNDFLLKGIKVDHTFLNLVNEKNMKLRLLKRKRLNRYDKFNYNFYKKVQTKIDSNLNITENKKKVIKKIVGLI